MRSTRVMINLNYSHSLLEGVLLSFFSVCLCPFCIFCRKQQFTEKKGQQWEKRTKFSTFEGKDDFFENE